MNTLITTRSDDELVEVLGASLYPTGSANSIKLVLNYCRAAGLDPMQKPVHIVPMWNGKLKCMQDVIMPGIGLYRTQANRTGQFAGMSEPEFGPMISAKIDKQDVTYPEWCKTTVRRQLASGHIGEFTAVEYWLENYAVKGGAEKSTAPNTMWAKRPRGQLAKCAQAQALRAAFPELGALPTAEEMEGKPIEGEFKEVSQPASVAGQEFNKLDNDTKDMLERYAAEVKSLLAELFAVDGDDEVFTEQRAALEVLALSKYEAHKSTMDGDMQTAWWALFASNERSALKRIGKTQKAVA